MSHRWEDAPIDCSRGLVRLWLRHGALLGVLGDPRTSGVAVPFVLERSQHSFHARLTSNLRPVSRGARSQKQEPRGGCSTPHKTSAAGW